MTQYIDKHTILTAVILLVIGALLIAKVDVPDAIWALLAVVSPGLVFKRPDAAQAPGASPKLPPPLPLLLLAVLSVGLASGCGGVSQQEVKHAAECSTLEEFYAASAKELIDRGLCDHVTRVEQCAPYAVLEELYIESVKARRCT